MIPLAVPNLSGHESEYLSQCVSSNFVATIGPFISTFEVLTGELSGFPHAIATNSGTSALHVALTALGVKPNDLVILPSYTFVATANAVRMCGANPWLIDIEEENWGLDPDLLAAQIAQLTIRRNGHLWHRQLNRRVSAIIAVCAAGQPPRLTELTEVAAAANIPFLLDAAGAAGSEYEGRKLGASVSHAILSFNGNKIFTAGGGGVFLSNSLEVANFVRHLSSTARVGDDYTHNALGFNYRMNNIQAAVGCAQLEQAAKFLQRKREIDSSYRAAWKGTSLTSFPHTDQTNSNCWMTGAVLPRNSCQRIGEVISELSSRGVQSRGFWKPMHLQEPYADCPRSRMRVTDDLWPRVLTLPSSTSLSIADQRTVIEATLAVTTSW